LFDPPAAIGKLWIIGVGRLHVSPVGESDYFGSAQGEVGQHAFLYQDGKLNDLNSNANEILDLLYSLPIVRF
jgi:probable HAF family extracellular repeat protein